MKLQHRFQKLTGFAAGVFLVGIFGASADSTITDWNGATLQAIRTSKIGPPMVARALAIVHTCTYDAWAAYDGRAVGSQLGATLRRPFDERTLANKERAVSYAAHRALTDLFPAQKPTFDSLMESLNLDPADASTDVATPTGIGNVAAAAVIALRHHDGANQLGDLGLPAYSDYTGYQAVNTVDEIIDPNRWQPLRFSNGLGGFVVPGYIGAHWGNVIPFALRSASEFRPEPPALYPNGAYVAEAKDLIELTAKLDDRTKMIAEYWADGPRSELPLGTGICSPSLSPTATTFPSTMMRNCFCPGQCLVRRQYFRVGV